MICKQLEFSCQCFPYKAFYRTYKINKIQLILKILKILSLFNQPIADRIVS